MLIHGVYLAASIGLKNLYRRPGKRAAEFPVTGNVVAVRGALVNEGSAPNSSTQTGNYDEIVTRDQGNEYNVGSNFGDEVDEPRLLHHNSNLGSRAYKSSLR